MSQKLEVRSRSLFIFGILILPLLLVGGLLSHAQTPEPPLRGVIRLKVKYKTGDVPKDLPRKRFFLIKGSLDDNKNLIDRIKQTSVVSRECYYRSKGASEALIKWLTENDCDSVYCREVEEKYLSGSNAVPEFQAAFNQGLREFKSPELARRWLTNNLPTDIRDGYYKEKQRVINTLIAQAGSNATTISVMTDRKGTAYLTNIEPGTYTVSNIVGSETGKTSIVWACEKEVKAVNLAMALRPLMLSNEKDQKVKCELVERQLPVCTK